ncbi:hypothetical protein RJY08_001462 [Vibrio alginolyticus]|uniref:hypothetical protein n=1 Tax=Vibrio alginolyticus TaxID=663 RepID=UPI001B831FAE|nr:hypothetical protein [Vibrio alginolyticus]ELC9520014.1 hypothetical protein [Vibrio alginolyticus]MCG9766453.1 hypothetical protein [Vibrio alginolyticus]HBC3811801.1 hypothetical protein [Vibrio alginolyticus]
MLSLINWFPSIATASVIGVVGFLLRNVIKTRLTNAVKHEYDGKLELIKADIQRKERDLEILKSSGVSSVGHRQTILFEKRVEAAEVLWKATVLVSGGQRVSDMMFRVKEEYVSANVGSDEKLQMFFKFIAQQADTDKMSEINAELVRPFVSKSAWSYYEAYHSIIWHFIAMASLYEKGLGHDLLKTEQMIETVKAVLPNYSDYIDQHGASSVILLLDELKDKVLNEIDNMLLGVTEDEQAVLRANEILEHAHKLKA